MLDLIKEAVSARQGETATYPQNVQIWMKLMAGSCLASVIFVDSRVGARWILAGHTMSSVVHRSLSFWGTAVLNKISVSEV